MSQVTGRAVRAMEVDLFSLVGDDRDAAVSGFTAGAEFPFVIVGGRLACAGALDVDRIIEAVDGLPQG